MKHIEWKLHGKEENLSWLKCGEYELVDVTRVFVKEIPYSDSITEQLEPAESDLRCIREEAQEMYQRDLKDDIPDEIYRQIVKWSSDSPPFVYKIRNGD